jgi:L-gulonate 3-dehydrogenase
VPLVELCGAPWTAPRDNRARARIYREIGQVPITSTARSTALSSTGCRARCWPKPSGWSARLRLAEDLDHTVKDGLGLRWSFMGPFETIELNAPGGIPITARATPASTRSCVGDPPGRRFTEPECGPGDRGVAASRRRPSASRADAAAQRAPRGAGRAQGAQNDNHETEIDPQKESKA